MKGRELSGGATCSRTCATTEAAWFRDRGPRDRVPAEATCTSPAAAWPSLGAPTRTMLNGMPLPFTWGRRPQAPTCPHDSVTTRVHNFIRSDCWLARLPPCPIDSHR